MKQLNAISTDTINQIVGMMNGWCAKIDHSDGSYMPVFISSRYEDDRHKVFVVGHYSSVDGDILSDPEMQFLYDESAGQYYPFYYRQDSIDVEQYSAKIDDGLILGINKPLQAEHTDFANQWLENIRYQQNL